jgi:hypothetical protein
MLTAFHPLATFSARFVRVFVSPAGEKVRTADGAAGRRGRGWAGGRGGWVYVRILEDLRSAKVAGDFRYGKEQINSDAS